MTSRIRLVHQGSIQTLESNISITKKTRDEFDKDTLRINHSKLKEILIQPEIGEKPVAFIGITGCMRTGKSFILNFILRYLRQKGWENKGWMGDENTKADAERDIGWKRGSERHTTGIRIFHEKFEIPIGDGNKTMIVMIMDTQGLFDFRTPEQMNKAILTLSTMLCSVQIFNVSGQINAHNLQYLETCVDFAQESAKNHTDDAFLKLQRLMILIRDYPEEDASFFTLKHGQQKLDKILNSPDGGDEQVNVRRKIRSTFSAADCFPLPTPGEVHKRNFQGINKEMTREFRESVKSFVEEIAHPNKLIPKQARTGRYLTARELLLMIAGCDNLFATKMFKASLMIEKNIESFYAAASQEAIFEYKKTMKSRVEPQMDESKLEKAHEETKVHAHRRFDSVPAIGCEEVRKRFKSEVEEGILKQYKILLDSVRTQQRSRDSAIERQFKCAVHEYRRSLLVEICNASDTASLHEIHNMTINTLVESKQLPMISPDRLREIAAETLEKYRDYYERKLHESAQAKQHERNEKIFRLVHLELLSECRRMWDEQLACYGSISDLEMCKDKIESHIRARFAEGAFNSTDEKYIRLFHDRLKIEKGKVRQKAGWKQAPEPTVGEKTSQEEYAYITKSLNGLMENCAKELQTQIKNFPMHSQEYGKLEEELTKKYENMFYGYCIPYQQIALEKLDGILCREYEKAKVMHSYIWTSYLEYVNAFVDEVVIKHEKSLTKAMIDTHIVDGGLQKYYTAAIQDVKDNIPNDIEIIMKCTDVAKKYFEAVLQEKMDSSLQEFLVTNRRNKDFRHLQDCSPPTPKKKGFAKALFSGFINSFAFVQINK